VLSFQQFSNQISTQNNFYITELAGMWKQRHVLKFARNCIISLNIWGFKSFGILCCLDTVLCCFFRQVVPLTFKVVVPSSTWTAWPRRWRTAFLWNVGSCLPNNSA
jgi:hypothetical protein